jgi:hypothetical protein
MEVFARLLDAFYVVDVCAGGVIFPKLSQMIVR